MFSLHPDHYMVVANDRRQRIERDAQSYRLVRDASAAAEPRRRAARDHFVGREGAPSSGRGGRLLLRRVFQIGSLRHGRAGQTCGTAGVERGEIVAAGTGSGVSFRDPDNVAFELFGPPAEFST
jgi:hypothetical protein